MTTLLLAALWLGLVAAGVLAMQHGASRLCGLLDALRSRSSLPGTVAGAVIGVATATPEMTVNVASVAFGWPDLGLGTALGSNVPALPAIFAVAYAATRFAARAPSESGHAPRVRPQVVEVQALPYLLVVLLLAAITLPPGRAGLAPLDALILTLAFAVYLGRALRRAGPVAGDPLPATRWRHAALAVPLIAFGGLGAVMASRRLVDLFGISDLVGGLFIIGFLCVVPEAFAAWMLAREERVTTAIAGAMSDGIASLTLALVPAALAGTAIGDTTLYAVNLAFLGATLAAYLAWNRRGCGERLGGGRVAFFAAAYAVYLAAVAVVLAR